MSSTHTSLDAAATERKARLAKLASLKRKQPPTEEDGRDREATSTSEYRENSDPTTTHLSLRNYDPVTRGPKLGFENAPIKADQETLESRAAELAAATKAKEEQEEKEKADGKGIDLFDLQPRKPNWDLKRDLSRKLEVLQQRTDNSIARLVKERLEGRKKQELNQGKSLGTGGSEGAGGTDSEIGETIGMGGADLVEGIHIREQQEEQNRRQDAEDDDVSDS